MSRLFISHSSRNDDWAIALRDWLVREGWSGEDDIFLDLDPARGIARPALGEGAGGSRHALRGGAVPGVGAWLASKWCHDEYQLANQLNKKLFALLIDDIALDRLPGGLRRRNGRWCTSRASRPSVSSPCIRGRSIRLPSHRRGRPQKPQARAGEGRHRRRDLRAAAGPERPVRLARALSRA